MLRSRRVLVLTSAIAAIAACVLALPITGCVGSPQPEPPTLEPELFTVEPHDCFPCDRFAFDLRGTPGAVSPDAEIVFTVLDGGLPALVRNAEADGSFFVTVDVFPGAEIRVQARRDGVYSEPFELVAREDGTSVVPADRPLAGCFVVSPREPVFLGRGGSASIVVENRCAEPLTISRVSPRTDALGVTVETASVPFVLGTGVPRTVTITAGDAGGEELVLLETDAPQRDRRTVLVVVDP